MMSILTETKLKVSGSLLKIDAILAIKLGNEITNTMSA